MSTKKHAQACANFYQNLADNDNGFTYRNLNSDIDKLQGPNMGSNIDILKAWKVNPPKPKKKIIDLHMMIGSDIDMEFNNNAIDKYWYIEKLVSINVPNNKIYMDRNESFFSNCRIRQNHWHSWQGGACPIPEGLIIKVKTRNNKQFNNDYGPGWRWNHRDKPTDIIAFKIIGIAENWTYKKESITTEYQLMPLPR